MINYENIEMENVFTEGFELSLPSATSLKITEGVFTHIMTSGTEVFTFPAIEFDVEADDELPVQYDVYLLESADKVSVMRTELGLGTVAVYEGEGVLMHPLLSFTLPPNTNDLNAIELNVRNIKLTLREEDTEDEVPTVEEKP